MRVSLSPREEETLARMARDQRPRSTPGNGGGDGSDGESSASLEEISADDFKGKDSSSSAATTSGMWMGGYPMMSRSYAAHALHSFAWAQAVQKKPLGLGPSGKEEEDEDDDELDMEVLDSSDGEKEEGELEEGEFELTNANANQGAVCETIDLDSDAPDKDSDDKEVEVEEVEVKVEEKAVKEEEEEIEEVDFDQRVGVILEDLELVTIEEAEKSFEGACTRLQKCFEGLKHLFPETGSPVPMRETIIQQAFIGIDTITNVASSYNIPRREQNKDLLLKLLFHIKNRYSDMLTPDQRNELDSRVRQLVFEDRNNAKDQPAGSRGNMNNDALPSSVPFESRTVNPFSSYGSMPRIEVPAVSRNRMVSPLLDLHADYDESSLPSPTRDNAPPLPLPKSVSFVGYPAAPTLPVVPKRVESNSAALHPYVTDAVQAVSSYQQRYGHRSIFSSERLPSPTPSEEADNAEDTHGEVSSSAAPMNVSQVPFLRHNSSSDSLGPPGFAKQGENLGPGPNRGLKSAPKSRDPRLRFMNPGSAGAMDQNQRTAYEDLSTPKDGTAISLANSRKHKPIDEPPADENMLKRQKSILNPKDTQLAPGRGGWLEDGSNVASYPAGRVQLNNNMVGMQKTANVVRSDSQIAANPNFSGTNASIVQAPQSIPTVSWPSLLMQLLEQQKKPAAEAQQVAVAPPANMISTASGNLTPGLNLTANIPKTTEIGQNPAVNLQMPAQTPPTNSQNDVGIVRMKPRDPRRILLAGLSQKGDMVSSEPTKMNSADSKSSKDNLIIRQQGEQAQNSGLSPQLALPPNMAPLTLSKNLNNPADIVPSSQLGTTAPITPPNLPQQVASSITKTDAVLTAVVAQPDQNAAAIAATAGPSGASPSMNPWGDVDHLLQGYDDQQKKAIHKERERRIMEQRKMFAARKLCLVLDLDHTLLNSAKFIEVEPVHEEILRKKEEQDRDMPQRHLFRFHHMGMWTKLRPGIWNFLEKASNLFELHLYTMGNKLYATEMAKILDPTGTLFAGRVISRGDDSDPFDKDEIVPKSKDLEGVLGMESAVVIIDDSVKVWPHNKHNLIQVERYTYFPCSRRQFGLAGPSLLEIDVDERPEDGTLASALGVIERIHQNFFNHQSLDDADVRSILALEQRKILAGCRILFSRVFPIGETNPHLHPLWQMAEQFGAMCTNQIDERVTHVVANSLGTDKVNWALSKGRFVVHTGWVEASALLYRRANELDFVVKPEQQRA